DRDIVAETRSQQAALEREQPQWYRQLVAQHDDPHDRRRALDATLAWRAISDQTEADSALGTPPPAGDRLRPHYDRAVERATPRQPWDEQKVRPAEQFTTWVKSDAYTGPDPAVAVPDRSRRPPTLEPDPHHAQPGPQAPSRGPELGRDTRGVGSSRCWSRPHLCRALRMAQGGATLPGSATAGSSCRSGRDSRANAGRARRWSGFCRVQRPISRRTGARRELRRCAALHR